MGKISWVRRILTSMSGPQGSTSLKEMRLGTLIIRLIAQPLAFLTFLVVCILNIIVYTLLIVRALGMEIAGRMKSVTGIQKKVSTKPLEIRIQESLDPSVTEWPSTKGSWPQVMMIPVQLSPRDSNTISQKKPGES